MIQREEFCSKVSRHLIWKQTPKKDEEIGVSGPIQHSHAPGTHFRATGHMLRRLVHASRHIEPINSLTCT